MRAKRHDWRKDFAGLSADNLDRFTLGWHGRIAHLGFTYQSYGPQRGDALCGKSGEAYDDDKSLFTLCTVCESRMARGIEAGFLKKAAVA